MTPTAAVSAVIPVHNGETYVGEAIQSVLEQTLRPIECIVVDDGSEDGTADVAAGFGAAVTVERQDRQGVSVARNRGARLATGELVAFLDHDDAWLPAKLERQVEALRERGATMGLCAMDVVDASGDTVETKHLRPREDLLTGMLMFDGTETVSCSSTGLVRREDFLSMGGFDPLLSMSADWDLLLRVLLTGTIAYVDEPLVRYRLHDSNMSRDVGRMERDMCYAFAKAFANPDLPDAVRRRKRRAYARLYRMLAGSYRDRHELVSAARALSLALLHDPRIATTLHGGSTHLQI